MLKVDWCSYEAAKYAVEHWHYSKSMPIGKLVKVGAWENNSFVGVVVFGRGASPQIGKPYGLEQTEVCELVRIALRTHETPVTRIVRIAIKMLRQISPNIELIVSYADLDQGHDGGIYKGGNWTYEGLRDEGAARDFIVHGKFMHNRSVHGLGIKPNLASVRRHLDPKAELYVTKGKHKYLMPLSDRTRVTCAERSKPYPERVKQAMAEDPSAQRQCNADPHAPKRGK